MVLRSEDTSALHLNWETQQLQLLAGVCSWATCSIGMMVFNKLALQAFHVACTLLLLQFAFTVVILLACSVHRSIHFGSRRDLLRWCIVIPFFIGRILSTMLALEDAPISMVMTFRALAPIMSLAVESAMSNSVKITWQIALSFFGTLLGMWLYIYDIEEMRWVGTGWVMLNNIFSVGDRLIQRYLLKGKDPVDISLTGVAFLNNMLSIPPVLVAAAFMGELSRLSEVWQHFTVAGGFWVLLSCIVSAGISYSTTWVTTLMSATSFLVCINASKFVIVALEIFVLRERGLQTMQILGTMVSISACIAYGLARMQAEKDEAREGEMHLSVEKDMSVDVEKELLRAAQPSRE